MLGSDEIAKINVEAINGMEPSITTPEALEFRRKVEAQIEAAKQQGLTPHAPYEIG